MNAEQIQALLAQAGVGHGVAAEIGKDHWQTIAQAALTAMAAQNAEFGRRIELAIENADLREANAELQSGQTYRYIGKDGKTVLARDLEDERDALRKRVAELEAIAESWAETAEHCEIVEGVCCCGDNMDNHSDPMSCGHSPVDHGAYHASQLLTQTRALLKGTPDAQPEPAMCEATGGGTGC